jgi:hypothetical protein
MGGIPIYLTNDNLSVTVFEEKIEQVKEAVHSILPGKFFDILRGNKLIQATFTLQVDELSLLNKQLECNFKLRIV